MSVFKLKKGEKVRVEIVKPKKDERRTQFNIVIDKKLKDRVKKLAKICRIPVSSFTEHSLEVGVHYIEQTLKDDNKRKILEKHLETKHLLNKKTDDEEYIIRITENNVNWIVLEAAEKMLKQITSLTRRSLEAGQAGNVESMDRYRSELFRRMVVFLNWITYLSHQLR